MTDVTTGAAPKPQGDSTKPASPTQGLAPATGAQSPSADLAAAERKTFEDGKDALENGKDALKGAAAAASVTTAQLASDADALLRASLETIRTKAEELGRQTTDWAGVRGDQARELIDERPLTVVAAAFGLGLLFGMAMRR